MNLNETLRRRDIEPYEKINIIEMMRYAPPAQIDPRNIDEWVAVLSTCFDYIQMYAYAITLNNRQNQGVYTDISGKRFFQDVFDRLVHREIAYDALDDDWFAYSIHFRMSALQFLTVYYLHADMVNWDIMRELVRAQGNRNLLRDDMDIYLPPGSVPSGPEFMYRAAELHAVFSNPSVPPLDYDSATDEE